MSTLQIALSGSSGMIGSALSQRLAADGHRVVPLIRPRSGSAVGPGADCASESEPQSIVWDPSHGLLEAGQLNGFDAVVHLAGRSIASRRWSAREKQRIRDSRVQATQRLVAQIVQLDQPPPVFIGASAVGIYGDCQSRQVDEASPMADDFLARVARDWEAACDPLSARGLRVVHPRLGMVLSPAGGALAQMLPLFRWRLGGPLGGGQQYWSWIALQDCVEALVWMLEGRRACGAYNVVAPTPLTNAQFTAQLAEALGKPAVLPAPKFALRLALGEMADALLLCSCRAVPGRLLQEGFSFRYPQLDEYLADALPAVVDPEQDSRSSGS